MKIVRVENLLSKGAFPKSPEWLDLRADILLAIETMGWPPGRELFTIHPESGKKRGQGNGVLPIKNGLMEHLRETGWKTEYPLDVATAERPGDVDAVYQTSFGFFALEWETGNVSSSHRALNKMALGLLKGVLCGGWLVIPSKAFAKYLTDRIGNYEELRPYFPLWASLPIPGFAAT